MVLLRNLIVKRHGLKKKGAFLIKPEKIVFSKILRHFDLHFYSLGLYIESQKHNNRNEGCWQTFYDVRCTTIGPLIIITKGRKFQDGSI